MEPPLTSPAYHWNTWTAERPAELTHLPSGLRITPVVYSDRAAEASDLPAGPLLRLGRRGQRDGGIGFTSRHQGTELDWTCRRRSPDGLELGWNCRAAGEWGLRYWVVICIHGSSDMRLSYDAAIGTVTAACPDRTLRFRCAEKPLMVTAHGSVEDLCEEMETKGYFYLDSRAETGPVLALRFNLDETPQMSVGTEGAEAADPQPSSAPEGSAGVQGALDAMHDVLAWNHVMDRVNNRPYTALTRNWSQRKFGGFGVWLNDILFHALMWTMFDPARARENIEAVFAWQTGAGNFPCLVTGNDAWLDRTQPPIASYVLWALYRSTQDLSVLSWAYPKLLANHRWWWANRSLGGSGLVAYGTTPGVGSGLYRGTKLGAKNESSMDNMAVHDEAAFDPETGLLQSADAGANSLLAMDGEILALMAQQLGRRDEADALAAATTAHKARIRDQLWDPERGVFANRLRDGKFVEALAPTSFFPMVAGIATADQAQAMVRNYLRPEAKFGGAFALPSAPRDQPAFQDNVYWRGRVWGPLNYWVYQGLVRYGFAEDAADLARKSRRMFDTHWKNRQCGENYDATCGGITNQPDADTFYTWGALLPALSVLEAVSDTPWDGLTLHLGRTTGSFGPVACSLGAVEITASDSGWQAAIDGRQAITGTGALKLSGLSWEDSALSATAEAARTGAALSFPGRKIQTADLDGQPLTAGSGQSSLLLPPGRAALTVRFTPQS